MAVINSSLGRMLQESIEKQKRQTRLKRGDVETKKGGDLDDRKEKGNITVTQKSISGCLPQEKRDRQYAGRHKMTHSDNALLAHDMTTCHIPCQCINVPMCASAGTSVKKINMT